MHQKEVTDVCWIAILGSTLNLTITRRLSWLLILLIPLLGACSPSQVTADKLNGSVVPTPQPAHDFRLKDVDGNSVSLADFEQQVVLLYFGYTFCPDVCPTTLSDLSQALSSIAETDQVQVIMITVDPERDVPEILNQYVNHFHPSFIGLWGEEADIRAAAEGYGVFYQKNQGSMASGYLIDHTARVFLVDKAGNYRLSYPYATPAEDIAADLKLLIREEP